MAITIITGEPGSGKTYLQTKILLDKIKGDRPAFANYSIHYPKNPPTKFNNIKYFLTIENGVVGIDEIHRYFSARNWQKFPDWAKAKFDQHRHDGLDIIGTCQWFGQIDKNVRMLTPLLIDCQEVKFAGVKFIKAKYFYRRKSKNGLRYRHVHKKTKFHRLDPDVYNRYDTKEKIIADAIKPDDVIPRFKF